MATKVVAQAVHIVGVEVEEHRLAPWVHRGVCVRQHQLRVAAGEGCPVEPVGVFVGLTHLEAEQLVEAE